MYREVIWLLLSRFFLFLEGSEKMGTRFTVYNNIVTEEKKKMINKENLDLMNDFLDYLRSVDRSPQTIAAYRNDLLIFFTIVLEDMNNIRFVDITKRQFARFQSKCINDFGWSPKRMRRVKSAISSMSMYIENMLDEEPGFEDYKRVINKIESPANTTVREKTVLSDEEVEQVLNTLLEQEQYQECAAIAVLAYSGMRKGELMQMRPEFFDEDHIVFGALHQTDLIRAKGRGKNGHQMKKWIMIAGDKYIMPWLNQRKELEIDSEWMFVTKHGDSWERRECFDTYMEHCSKLLGKPVYAHSFRHYVCTKLINDYNLPTEVVREFYQWESVEMTKIYNDRSAADDFGKYFSAEGVKKQEQKTLSDL